jgi:Ca-activated chloride channel family protein
VDTASYSNVRRYLQSGRLPPRDAVRVEELVNYFRYHDPEPADRAPLAVAAEAASCPWEPRHRLVRVSLTSRRDTAEDLPPRNLVFLIDVSGSMAPPNRLPLVQYALGLLIDRLRPEDRVAIVTYAGEAAVALPPTPGDRKEEIRAAVGRLRAGGSTNGGDGIRIAYRLARRGLGRPGVHRVILATDGDFNVGVTDTAELARLAAAERDKGVYLTVLGFGIGNLKDARLEQLAQHGAGHYAYIDTDAEAQKVFVEQGAALVTVARDVKVQVTFNNEYVDSYRLIGYEGRLLPDRAFADDSRAAGAVGAGHAVTALYEVGVKGDVPRGEALLTVQVRYKDPDGGTIRGLSRPAADDGRGWPAASDDFRFAAAVAAFGQLLRDTPAKGAATWDLVLALARPAVGADPEGRRAEFVRLAATAAALAGPAGAARAKGE